MFSAKIGRPNRVDTSVGRSDASGSDPDTVSEELVELEGNVSSVAVGSGSLSDDDDDVDPVEIIAGELSSVAVVLRGTPDDEDEAGAASS
jgi:hypothetical protein